MSTKPTRLLVVVCSTRPGALGPAIGEWFVETVQARAEELGATVDLVSLGDVGLPLLDEEEHPSTGIYRNEHTRRWSRIVDSHDGFVFITPEYNFGMPATLKNALDYLGREWAWKPAGFISYGNTSAGTRSVQHAKPVVTTLRLVPLGATLAIRIADDTADGRVLPHEHRATAAVDVLDEAVRLSRALTPVREWDEAESGPVPGSYLRALGPSDAAEVLVLQRCSWADEALANPGVPIPALDEGIADVESWLSDWSSHGLWLDGRLVAMVRARPEGGDAEIGRLAVVPDLRRRGIGAFMLGLAERRQAGARRWRLTTGARSGSNLAMYRAAGYEVVGSHDGETDLVKESGAPAATVASPSPVRQ